MKATSDEHLYGPVGTTFELEVPRIRINVPAAQEMQLSIVDLHSPNENKRNYVFTVWCSDHIRYVPGRPFECI